MVAKPVKSTSLVLSLSAIAQFEEHRSVITYVRSLLFGCLTDVNPALSPWNKRTSRLGSATSPWTTACSGSCGVLMFGRPSASFQSSRRNTGGRRRLCARQSDPATHRPKSPNTATGTCLVIQPLISGGASRQGRVCAPGAPQSRHVGLICHVGLIALETHLPPACRPSDVASVRGAADRRPFRERGPSDQNRVAPHQTRHVLSRNAFVPMP